MRSPPRPGLYRVKLGHRWTVAEYILPNERDEEPYWVVPGSEESFPTKAFVAIGTRVQMPQNIG
jgi:hypothetical protein